MGTNTNQCEEGASRRLSPKTLPEPRSVSAAFAFAKRQGRRRPQPAAWAAGAVFLVATGVLMPVAAPAQTETDRLADLSLEELMNVDVTSVSKRAEPLRQSAAAVHVLTGNEIRESGATSIPEALRLVPGVHVGRVDSGQWAISTRGFSELFANKQLVMIDGRSVYTPLFSGVFWDVTDTFMEDIDRIEVIRGPGASLWGANAVNGVINVITKHARDTQGSYGYGGAGSYERGFTGARHGGTLGEHGHFRVYGKHFQRDNLRTADGEDADDQWHMNRGGFRADIEPEGPSRFTFQGDIYNGESTGVSQEIEPDPGAPGQYRTVPRVLTTDLYGGNVLGRVTYSGLDDSEVELQSYYDQTVRDNGDFRENRRTFDVEGQHTFRAGDRHQLMWGGGYRLSADRIRNSSTTIFTPDRRTDHLFGAFVQDEIALVHDRLFWTSGSKFEHNDYTGFEVQPTTRLLWLPTDRQAVWGSVSRAVRSPSRAEHDVRFNSEQGGTKISIFGQDDFRSEELIAYELGYRVQPEDRITLDFALFYNDYSELSGIESEGFQMDPGDPHVRFVATNALSGETYGGEASATLQATEWWRWRLGYSFLRMQVRNESGTDDPFGIAERTEGRSPRHQVFVRSALDLPAGWDFSAGARYVDNLPGNNIGSYTEMDARLAWRPGNEDVEFSLVGRNLLNRQHAEAVGDFSTAGGGELVRSFYGQVAWGF